MFEIDEKILSASFVLGDWPLSRVLLKNEKKYRWFLLVPRKMNAQELFHLDNKERQILMNEISVLSLFVQRYFQVDKLNIGALGNIVSQLHIHVVGRCRGDALWPHSIWQSAHEPSVYQEEESHCLVRQLQEEIASLSLEIECC